MSREQEIRSKYLDMSKYFCTNCKTINRSRTIYSFICTNCKKRICLSSKAFKELNKKNEFGLK